MATGDLILKGTLFVGGVKQLLPTKPWRVDGAPQGAPSSAKGNILKYVAGETIDIRDTDSETAYKMRWRQVNYNSKELYIADRNVLVNVSYNDLLSQGLIHGKEVLIDGRKFILRTISGGSSGRSYNDYYGTYRYGSPIDNEWDMFVCNEANLSGLPQLTDKDTFSSLTSSSYGTLSSGSAAAKAWHWAGIQTITSDLSVRGYHPIQNWQLTNADRKTEVEGWRPVLEALPNEVPILTLSTTNDQTLYENDVFYMNGTASDMDNGDVVSVQYQINAGTAKEVKSFTNSGAAEPFSKSLSFRGGSLYDGETLVASNLKDGTAHTLKVWAEDSKGGKSSIEERTFQTISRVVAETKPNGTYTARPSFDYVVKDPEGKSFTVTEAIDGVTFRTIPNVASGTTLTYTPSDLAWALASVGKEIAVSITADSGDGIITKANYMITRTVPEIDLQLKTPWETNAAARRIMLNLEGNLPTGANTTIHACNNAFDENPAWENATQVLSNGLPYVFSNQAKTADKWGVSFKVRIGRGAVTERIYLDSISGAFD